MLSVASVGQRCTLLFNQTRLGIFARVDEATASACMNQYERGTRTPGFELACRLALVMDIST